MHVCLFMSSSNTSKISRNSGSSWDYTGLRGSAQKHVMPSLVVVIIQNNITIESNQCHIISPSHDHLFSCLQISCINISFVDPRNQLSNELITCIKISSDLYQLIARVSSSNECSWKLHSSHSKMLCPNPAQGKNNIVKLRKLFQLALLHLQKKTDTSSSSTNQENTIMFEVFVV